MVRFLSPAWLARLDGPGPGARGAGAPHEGEQAAMVLRRVVTGTPEGTEARYDVVVADGRGTLRQAAGEPADVVVTSDYPTAAAVASGRLSTQAALAAGRLKVTGSTAALASLASRLGGVDPLPEDLRAETEFP